MIEKKVFTFTACCLLGMATASVHAAEMMAVAYGTIAAVGQQQKDTSGAQKGGAVLGGLVGLYSGKGKSKSNKALRTLGGATVGKTAGRVTSQGTVMSYTIDMVTGGTVRVVMEDTGYRQGDCVAVERGNTSNIRRVSDAFCQTEFEIPQQYVLGQAVEASECAAAKQELLNATDEAAIRVAGLKMEILCED